MIYIPHFGLRHISCILSRSNNKQAYMRDRASMKEMNEVIENNEMNEIN